MSEKNKDFRPPQVGQSYPYEVQYGPTQVLAVHDKDPVTGLWKVDIILKDRIYDPKTGQMYGQPPGPPG